MPLDRTGAVPGTIGLHVEELPPQGPSRGVIFLIAGGPGQGSASSFDLGNSDEAQFFQFLFPSYTLVAYDDRGTGKSGLIDCPGLQKTVTTSVEEEAKLAQDCAQQIGPTRQFYSTRDHADDMESVRQALGFGKIGLYGVSYGTKLALAYALAYPNEVERIVLDSVLPTNLPDPYDRNVAQEMPKALAELCGGGRCRGITSNLPDDAATLANRLEAKPAAGKIIAPNGKTVVKHMNGEDVLSVIIDSDLNPGIQAELPAAIHAGRIGNMRPLLRLFDLDNRTSLLSAPELSFGLYAATSCADVQFPWAPSTPTSDRGAILSSAVAALPPGSFGPFGNWAARTGDAFFCELWPSPAGNAPEGNGPLPNVPVLTFSGGVDFRTPTAQAAAITALFPQGHLVVVPGWGHNVLNQGLQNICPFTVLRQWLDGATPPPSCPRQPAYENAVSAFTTVAPARNPTVTAMDVAKSIRDGEAASFVPEFNGSSIAAAGLYGGRVKARTSTFGFTLTNYSVVPGLRVTGTLRITTGSAPFGLVGIGRVSGASAARGSLKAAHGRLTGTLAGRHVSVKL